MSATLTPRRSARLSGTGLTTSDLSPVLPLDVTKRRRRKSSISAPEKENDVEAAIALTAESTVEPGVAKVEPQDDAPLKIRVEQTPIVALTEAPATPMNMSSQGMMFSPMDLADFGFKSPLAPLAHPISNLAGTKQEPTEDEASAATPSIPAEAAAAQAGECFVSTANNDETNGFDSFTSFSEDKVFKAVTFAGPSAGAHAHVTVRAPRTPFVAQPVNQRVAFPPPQRQSRRSSTEASMATLTVTLAQQKARTNLLHADEKSLDSSRDVLGPLASSSHKLESSSAPLRNYCPTPVRRALKRVECEDTSAESNEDAGPGVLEAIDLLLEKDAADIERVFQSVLNRPVVAAPTFPSSKKAPAAVPATPASPTMLDKTLPMFAGETPRVRTSLASKRAVETQPQPQAQAQAQPEAQSQGVASVNPPPPFGVVSTNDSFAFASPVVLTKPFTRRNAKKLTATSETNTINNNESVNNNNISNTASSPSPSVASDAAAGPQSPMSTTSSSLLSSPISASQGASPVASPSTSPVRSVTTSTSSLTEVKLRRQVSQLRVLLALAIVVLVAVGAVLLTARHGKLGDFGREVLGCP